MESIGLLTPPAQRMSMSWSTFWRRPEEKKFEPLLWLGLATEVVLFRSVCAYAVMWYASQPRVHCTSVDWRRASKTCLAFSKRASAVKPAQRA